MSAGTRGPAALGLRAGRGGSVVVAVTVDSEGPSVVLSTFLATAAEGDRLAFEPYHMAFEIAQATAGKVTPEAEAAVAEARQRQDRLAAEGLGDILHKLEVAGCKASAAALLVNRAGWITDLLSHSLSDPAHPPVAEGLAVRDALRFACRAHGVAIVEMDEKSLFDAASVAFGAFPADIEARLTGLGATVGRPWRKEQKLACLSAWLAASA